MATLAPSASPDQLVAVAINSIATNASWSDLLHDARRLCTSLRTVGRDDLADEIAAGARALGDTLAQVGSLSIQQGAELEKLAAALDAMETADDGGLPDGADDPVR